MNDDIFELNTKKLAKQSTSVSNLRRDSTIFFTNSWKKEVSDLEQRNIIEEIIEDDTFPKSAAKEKDYCFFKTPVSTVITASKPERDFIDALCKKENASMVTAWVKSRDRNFYEIEYSYKYSSGGAKARRYFHGKFRAYLIITTK